MNETNKLRLSFTINVAQKELKHLEYSNAQVFPDLFTVEKAVLLDSDEVLAEKVEAFTSRFCRYQDTLGEKLIPLWVSALGEKPKAYIDNLNLAEKLGVLPSVEQWMIARELRNQMVHEYIEDPLILSAALQKAHESVAFLRETMLAIMADLEGRV